MTIDELLYLDAPVLHVSQFYERLRLQNIVERNKRAMRTHERRKVAR